MKEKVVVPLIEDMDDETFIKHLEKRHAHHTQVEEFISRHSVGTWLPLYRTFHEYIHYHKEVDDHEHDE